MVVTEVVIQEVELPEVVVVVVTRGDQEEMRSMASQGDLIDTLEARKRKAFRLGLIISLKVDRYKL